MDDLHSLKILVTDMFVDDQITLTAYLVLMTEIDGITQDLNQNIKDLNLAR